VFSASANITTAKPFMSHPNTALTEEESSWVEEFAGRLQLIRVDTAAATPQQRREYLQEEVARGFKTVPPSNHKRYLEALLARFPVAGQVVKSVPAPMSAPVAAVPVAESPEQTLERFLGLMAAMPKEKQDELIRRLFSSELMGAYLKVLVLEFPEEITRDLGLSPDQKPHPERLARLTVLLIDNFCNLDQAALTVLKDLAPRREILKPRDDFRKAAARFLTSENETMDPQIKAVSVLLGALLRAMLALGKEFGNECRERFSPEAIEEIVEAEGKGGFLGMGKTKKERCWDKYKELAADFITPELIERRIKDRLAEFVERKVRGGR